MISQMSSESIKWRISRQYTSSKPTLKETIIKTTFMLDAGKKTDFGGNSEGAAMAERFFKQCKSFSNIRIYIYMKTVPNDFLFHFQLKWEDQPGFFNIFIN